MVFKISDVQNKGESNLCHFLICGAVTPFYAYFPKDNKAFSFTRRFFLVYLFSVSVNSFDF